MSVNNLPQPSILPKREKISPTPRTRGDQPPAGHRSTGWVGTVTGVEILCESLKRKDL